MLLAASCKATQPERTRGIHADPDRSWRALASFLTSEINLDTHILDVVNVMKWQELNDVVLVGHSYGGMVISGVAERLPGEVHLIFCNARRFLPGDRTSFDRFTAAKQPGNIS